MMLDALNDLIERRIREAQQRGEFDDLPGAGQPLSLDDEPLVPEELRVAYRMLKNAGLLPPELEAARDIDALTTGAVGALDGHEPGGGGRGRHGGREGTGRGDADDRRRRRRMFALSRALERRGADSSALAEYRHRMLDRIAGARRPTDNESTGWETDR